MVAQVLCFFSRGYFLSDNSMREVRAAIQYNKPMIAVHEMNVSHGGGERALGGSKTASTAALRHVC